jgi:probable F420-dependent oxidoreductase
MRISFAAPQTGELATLEAVAHVADLAESIGIDGLWALDRLLLPVAPRDPYPATPDGVLSPQFGRVLDPLTVLTFVAARTQRVRLGTGVLVAPWYPPMLLARSLASLDVLSAGRLDVGLGVGWSRDELSAVGVTGGVGTRTDELVEVLEHVWDDASVVEHAGRYATVPPSRVGLRPVQRPRPPLYFPAFSPAAMARLVRSGDGWLPASLPLDAMASMWSMIGQMAADGGRDPSLLQLVVRANCFTVLHQPERGRQLFQGDVGQLASDVRRCQELGAHEVVLDLQFTEASASLDRFADTVAEVSEAVADVRPGRLTAVPA